LRRLLGDEAKQPTYIATVTRLGYRMIAKVSVWQDSAKAQTESSANSTSKNLGSAAAVQSSRGSRLAIGVALSLLVVLILVAVFLSRRQRTSATLASAASAVTTVQSVGVLPFLDLTEGMQEETFADGMTEELIDKLSKMPGLRVPAPTASFYFKGKRIPIGEIARALGVAYVLDGSVRKSGRRLRVAARLVRADNGFVVWTETYDRPFEDIIMLQDDIAGEVAKALKSSIVAKPDSG